MSESPNNMIDSRICVLSIERTSSNVVLSIQSMDICGSIMLLVDSDFFDVV